MKLIPLLWLGVFVLLSSCSSDRRECYTAADIDTANAFEEECIGYDFDSCPETDRLWSEHQKKMDQCGP